MRLKQVALDKLINYKSESSFGSKLRARRIAPLLSLIENISLRDGKVSIIDIGGTTEYWRILPLGFVEKFNIHITIVNLPGTVLPENHDHFSYCSADGCELSDIPDHSYHISHSNSVIEHVGNWERMKSFAWHMRRIAQYYYVQTPNFWFPIEPHCLTPFFHWFPLPVQTWLVQRFSLGSWKKVPSIDSAVKHVESYRLITKSMFRVLFPDAIIRTETVLGLPKSIIGIRSSNPISC